MWFRIRTVSRPSPPYTYIWERGPVVRGRALIIILIICPREGTIVQIQINFIRKAIHMISINLLTFSCSQREPRAAHHYAATRPYPLRDIVSLSSTSLSHFDFVWCCLGRENFHINWIITGSTSENASPTMRVIPPIHWFSASQAVVG